MMSVASLCDGERSRQLSIPSKVTSARFAEMSLLGRNAVLDRAEAMRGYESDNVRLICEVCPDFCVNDQV